jgi:hypothetical protein
VLDTKGNRITSTITVGLYQGASLIASQTVTPSYAPVVFPNLAPGIYRVDFAGTGIKPYSKSETVVAGWTTEDAVYLTVVQTPPPPPPFDPEPYFVLGVIGAALLVGVVAVLNGKRRRAARSSRVLKGKPR